MSPALEPSEESEEFVGGRLPSEDIEELMEVLIAVRIVMSLLADMVVEWELLLSEYKPYIPSVLSLQSCVKSSQRACGPITGAAHLTPVMFSMQLL